MARLLDRIDSPADLKRLAVDDLPAALPGDPRRDRGHLRAERRPPRARSLGAVEIDVALHYVFDSPIDKLVWDVGHQAYAHKLLTGRRDRFRTIRTDGRPRRVPRAARVRARRLRRRPRLDGDLAALGMIEAERLQRRRRARSSRVVGDGALTGGVAFEGLNQAGYLGPRPARRPERQRDVDLAERRRAVGVVLEEVRVAHLQPVAPTVKDFLAQLPKGAEAIETHPARHQRDEGARHARHPLRGARVPLRRPGGRARREGARRDVPEARARSTVPVLLHAITHEGEGLRAGGVGQARPAATASRSSTWRPASRRRKTATTKALHRRLRRRALRGDGARRRASSRSRRRCSRAPASSRRRSGSRTGPTTSASPSSTR